MVCQGHTKRPFFQRTKVNALPCTRGKARGTGDTTTLHSLKPAPAFEGRVGTQHLHSAPARLADPNTYTRYWVSMTKTFWALLTLL